MYNLQEVVQVIRTHSGAFAIERLVRKSGPLSSLLYVIALEPFLWRLNNKKATPALGDIPFVGLLSANESSTPMISLSSCPTVWTKKAVKKAVARYKQIAGAMIKVCLIWRTIGSLKDWLTLSNLCPRCGWEMWTIPFLTSSQTPRLKVDVSLFENAVRPFATFPGLV